jgi:hypothetical protein
MRCRLVFIIKPKTNRKPRPFNRQVKNHPSSPELPSGVKLVRNCTLSVSEKF